MVVQHGGGLTGEGHLLMQCQCIIAVAGSHMEGDRCHTFTKTLRDFICVHILHDVQCELCCVQIRHVKWID
jgi:hypothetical protein